jgi:hypothetical protein
MAKRVQRQLSRLRVTFMMVLVLAACGALTFLVRALPDSWDGALTAAFLGVVNLLITASLLEWLVHRYVYHRRWLPFLRRIYAIHHQGHHHAIFPTWRYVTNGPVRRHRILTTGVSSLHTSTTRNALVKLSHFSFYLAIGGVCVWLPAWLLTSRAAFLAGMVAASAVVADLFVRVHDAIHYPGRYRWIEVQPWFRFLENHHYIHHVDTEANVNFLLPLADWLLGTMRRSLSPEELALHGTLVEAKSHPAGMSEPAKTVARPRLARS